METNVDSNTDIKKDYERTYEPYCLHLVMFLLRKLTIVLERRWPLRWIGVTFDSPTYFYRLAMNGVAVHRYEGLFFQ